VSIKRVLVTGHLGYIGACLVPQLQAAGFELTGCDTNLYAACSFGSEPLALPNLACDIRDLQADDLRGFDAVVHLAGLSNDPLGELNPALTDAINAQATVRLGALARDAGVQRFVFSSSCSNYGAAGDELLDEDAPLNPVTAYGRSKVAAEQGLQALASEQFSPVYLRNATVYGCSPRIRFDLVVNNLVAWAHTTGQVMLKSKGLAWRPLVHVNDVAAAFVAALQAPPEAVHNRAFNIGRSTENYRVRELAGLVAARMPGTQLAMAEGADVDVRNYRVDCSRAQNSLPGWRPAWTVADGIDALATEYRRVGLGLDEFEGGRYQRLAHLQQRLAAGELGTDLRPSAIAACTICQNPGLLPIRDYGPMPPADAFVPAEHWPGPPASTPLQLVFCPNCSLLQLLETPPPQALFGADYTYLSSCSDSWLAHARDCAGLLQERFGLGAQSLVLEVASNDGYLLRWFAGAGVPVLGIEPAPLPAAAARKLGVPTREAFFTPALARQLSAEGVQASVVVANNVLAHVPDPQQLVAAVLEVLAPDGSWVIEVPHVLELLRSCAFDTVYHEHRCYFSLHALQALFAPHGLHINDLQRLASHGGSLRLFVSRAPHSTPTVSELLALERGEGLLGVQRYQVFAADVQQRLQQLAGHLQALAAAGKTIAAYGAAAKGTILLNSLGAASEHVRYVVDRNPHKQGRRVPGVGTPICALEQLELEPPDVLLLLPWNLEREISAQLAGYLAAGGQMLVPLPTLHYVGAGHG
jgi:nucleoside-diphosphate-sugar epimerase/SAM-dependent methyltransferase